MSLIAVRDCVVDRNDNDDDDDDDLLPGQRLWLSSPLSSSLLSHHFPLTVFRWTRLSISSSLSSLDLHSLHAGGKEAYSGHLLVQVSQGPLLQADISKRTLVAVPVPQEELLCVSCVPGHVWLVTGGGKVYLQGRYLFNY